MSSSPIHIELFAGLTSSATSSLIFHPFDTIRINQINKKWPISTTVKYLLGDARPRTVFRSLYNAMPVNCLAYSATYGIYFSVNRHFKNENYFGCSHPYMLYATSSIPATLCSMSVTNPLWTIKSVQMSSCESAFRVMSKIYKTSGLCGFQKGLLFGYLNGMNGVITFTLYDICKDLFNAQTSVDYLVCSGLSKTCAYFITFPIFALRIKHQITQDTLTNVFLKQVSAPRTLYYGLLMTLVQMVPRTCVMIVLYEKFKNLYTH